MYKGTPSRDAIYLILGRVVNSELGQRLSATRTTIAHGAFGPPILESPLICSSDQRRREKSERRDLVRLFMDRVFEDVENLLADIAYDATGSAHATLLASPESRLQAAYLLFKIYYRNSW